MRIVRLAGKAPYRRRPVNSTLGLAMSMVAAVSASCTAKALASATHRSNPCGLCAARCTAASVQRLLCGAPRAKRPNLAAEYQRSVGGAAATLEAPPVATSAGGGSEYWQRSLSLQVSAAAQAQPSAPSSHARRCLTYRSTGAPTAGHQARSAGTRYIVCGPGLASCRRRPVNSTLGSAKQVRSDGRTPNSQGARFGRAGSE